MDCAECGGHGYRLKSNLPWAWWRGYMVETDLNRLYPGSYSFVAELRRSLFKEPCLACAGTGVAGAQSEFAFS